MFFYVNRPKKWLYRSVFGFCFFVFFKPLVLKNVIVSVFLQKMQQIPRLQLQVIASHRGSHFGVKMVFLQQTM